MRRASRWSIGVSSVLLATGVAHGQFIVRGGLFGGSDTGQWGRTGGFVIGIDELRPSKSTGWWSTRLDISYRWARLADDAKLSALALIDPVPSPPDTIPFKNSFTATSITIGARYEPCRPSLGFRQTPYQIISPFAAWHLGYARFEHDLAGRPRSVSGLQSAHGVPVGGSVGVMFGWGGPPENALDPNVSSAYWGVELSLDATMVVWVKNREVIGPVSGLPDGLDAPTGPTITLRVMVTYRTAPVRRR